jgi:hypothetical protein
MDAAALESSITNFTASFDFEGESSKTVEGIIAQHISRVGELPEDFAELCTEAAKKIAMGEKYHGSHEELINSVVAATMRDPAVSSELQDEFKDDPCGVIIAQYISEGGTLTPNFSDLYADAMIKAATGEEYHGPHQELISAVVVASMTEQRKAVTGEDLLGEADVEATSATDLSRIDIVSHRNRSETPDGQDLADPDLDEDRHPRILAKDGPDEKDSGRSSYYHGLITRILQSHQNSSQDAGARDSPSGDEIAALRALFNRDWFRRVWIIQEASVSSQVSLQCGARSVDWWAFYFGFMITQKMHRGARIGPAYYHNIVRLSSTRSGFHARASRGGDGGSGDDEVRGMQLMSLLLTYRPSRELYETFRTA